MKVVLQIMQDFAKSSVMNTKCVEHLMHENKYQFQVPPADILNGKGHILWNDNSEDNWDLSHTASGDGNNDEKSGGCFGTFSANDQMLLTMMGFIARMIFSKFYDYSWLENELDEWVEQHSYPDMIILGGASGVDFLAD